MPKQATLAKRPPLIDPRDPIERTPFAYICAVLEEAGYRREQMGKLTRSYFRRVIQYPRTKDGRLEPPQGAKNRQPSRTDVLRKKYAELGLQAHLVEVLVRRAIAREEAALARAKARVAEMRGAKKKRPISGGATGAGKPAPPARKGPRPKGSPAESPPVPGRQPPRRPPTQAGP